MSPLNNKRSGSAFENDFRKLLYQNGFWSHKLVENENGAPFDIIAVKNGCPYAFDCKECGTDRFPFNRVEDNQITGMSGIEKAGAEAYFVFRNQKAVHIVSAKHLFDLMENGERSIKITTYSTLEGWLLWH